MSRMIDAVFAKLALVYGRDFTSRWEGMDLELVKRDWEHELGGFMARPEAIRHALQHLPLDRPPNVLQFRALCNGYTPPPAPALEEPRSEPSPEDRARLQAILDGLRGRMVPR